jgi:hypothetical protein
VSHNDESRTFTVLRVLLLTYAPTFNTIFAHPSVRSIKIQVVPPRSFDISLDCLRTEFHRDGARIQHLWDGQDVDWIDDSQDGCYMTNSDGDPIMDDGEGFGTWEYAEAAIEMYIIAQSYENPAPQN